MKSCGHFLPENPEGVPAIATSRSPALLQDGRPSLRALPGAGPIPPAASSAHPAIPGTAPFAKLHCDILASFAIAFRRWRLQDNVPLKKIALDLGVSISTVNSWELGTRFPTGRHFQMLTDYTGVPPCRLFCVMADRCVPSACLLAMPRKMG